LNASGHISTGELHKKYWVRLKQGAEKTTSAQQTVIKSGREKVEN